MIPQRMQAILLDPNNQTMRWQETDMPHLQEHEVLIRIAAAGLNRADILQRKGKYPPPPGASAIMGMEVSGEIVALGADVSQWKIGDYVCALLAGGGYAEYCAAPAAQCLPIPGALSLVEAAALPEAVATVWANLFEAGRLQAGETALVHGGSSGIGIMAIQLVKHFGARIFVTAGSEEKCAACLALGADLAINYNTKDFVQVIRETTKNTDVNLVLDMIGGDYVARNLAVLAPEGRHVSIATQKGAEIGIDMRLIMMKRLVVTGSTLRSRSLAEKARLIDEIRRNVWPLYEKNRLKPLIDRVFPINQAGEAHKRMESSGHIGKIVFEVQAAL